MPTTTVRISRETQQILRFLANREGESIQAVLEKAVSDYRRRRILEEGNQAYARLRANPEAWAEELEERKVWEGTLADGLQDCE
jgi:hypothetical protein